MYRAMLYYLLVLWVATIILSLAQVLPYNSLDILLTGLYLGFVCQAINLAISQKLRARTKPESAAITALILTLIIGPLPFFDNLLILTLLGLVAMASKYLLAIRHRHLVNPAALAVFLSATLLGHGASWWVASQETLPLIILGGIIVLIKIKRQNLILGFLSVYFLTQVLFATKITLLTFLSPVIWFFVLVMLVEPLTSPAAKSKQALFGVLVAFVYFLLPKIIPGYAYGLETALLIGNLLYNNHTGISWYQMIVEWIRPRFSKGKTVLTSSS